MLAIQKFLRSHNPKSAPRHAEEKFHIKSYEEGDLVLFNYSMIDSKRGVQEVEECRGLILEKPSWNVVAMPFYRFYNADEKPYAYDFHGWSDYLLQGATLWEKRDGTLCTLYWYRNAWRVATRGRPYADGPINADSRTFHELFWETLYQYNPELDVLPKDQCYMFELTGPFNRVVTPYRQNELRLLGIRHIDNEWGEYRELHWLAAKRCDELFLHVGMPNIYEFKSLNHIENQLKMIGGLEEGFVLVNYNEFVRTNCECPSHSFCRVKIKSPTYLKAARMIGNGFSEKRALAMVLAGKFEVDNFLHYFPEYEGVIKSVGDELTALCDDLDHRFKMIRDLAVLSRKKFAEKAKDTKAPWVMFQLLDKKADTAFGVLSHASLDKVARIILG